MECRRCGRVAPADAETGYDADDFCPRPECQAAQEHAEEDELVEAQLRQQEMLDNEWRNS